LVWFGVAASGYAICAATTLLALEAHVLSPPGDIGWLFGAVGEAIRAGHSPYGFPGPAGSPFFYAPPWALFFGAFTLVPEGVRFTILLLADIAALRYMARSWLGIGFLLCNPIVPFEVAGGTLNLLMAAAIVAGVRGSVALPVVFGLAKISPALALRPSAWRRAAAIALLIAAVTLPWAWLWPAWVVQLWTALGTSFGPMVPVPLAPRLLLAAALLATRRPVAIATAAVVATPAFYWGSLVLLVAPVAIGLDWWDERRSRRERLSLPEAPEAMAVASSSPD
jgi:hypothetical protein